MTSPPATRDMGYSFAVLQLPMLDVRRLRNGNGGEERLARPSWPDPVVGVEFVREVGGVVRRPLGAVAGWDGEPAFCAASRLLRMAEDPAADRISLTPHYRRLFGSEDGFRLDLGFRVRAPVECAIPDIVARVLSLRVRVRGGNAIALARAGRPVADRLAGLTGSGRSQGSGGSLVAGVPAVLIEHDRHANAQPHLARIRYQFRQPGGGPEFEAYELRGRRHQRRQLRAVRGAAWRLQSELELLRALGRVARSDADRIDYDRTVDAIARRCAPLARESRNGVRQPPLLALLGYPHKLDELIDLADLVRDRSLGLSRSLELAAERAIRARAAQNGITVWGNVTIDSVGEIIVGDQIRASGGSIVNSRSTVVNSFNSIQTSDAELATALEKVLTAAQESKNSEAIELAEGLIESAAAGKQGIFRAAWYRLVDIVPVVGSISGVLAAVDRFLRS